PRNPPAEPTSATTWLAAGATCRSTVGVVTVQKHPADDERITLRFLDDAIVPLRPGLRPERVQAQPDAFRKIGALVEGAERGGERGVERLRLLGEQRLRAERVADPAAEAKVVVARSLQRVPPQDGQANGASSGKTPSREIASADRVAYSRSRRSSSSTSASFQASGGARTRPTTAAPSFSSGSTACGRSATMAFRGMSGKAASLGSCTSTEPPRCEIAAEPAAPSSREPERTTPIAPSRYASAALRKSRSIAGRWPFSCGPRTTRSLPSTTMRWWSGGAT